MRNRKVRLLSLLLATVMLLGLLAGCSSDKGSGTGTGTKGGDKDSVVIATANETPSLSPTEHNAVAGDYMNQLTYSMLFRTDKIGRAHV